MINEIVQSIVDRSLPELTKAHTYSSENSDIYEAFDNGQNDYRVRTSQQLTKVLTEVVGELVDKEKIQKLINEARGNTDYPVEDYELRADRGDYHPNEHEKCLIEDYHQGYIEFFDEELLKKLTDRNIEILKGNKEEGE